ncbi:MAG: 50S ribosomal protein L35 [Actinomycetota bacterium]|nr:50S ribosomal protein L35 [Actinomycetota bacterium]
MPKMKTKRGAYKRFKTTGNGKILRKKAYNGHLFVNKSSKRKRNLERETEVSGGNERIVRASLGLKSARKQ